MSKLIISASFGPIENRQQKEAILKDPISQRVLAVFFRCQPEDLEKIAIDYHVPQEIKSKGPNHLPTVFYNIDAIPGLLSGLQKEATIKGDFKGKEWLSSLDTSQDTFEIQLPSGSKIKFTKD